jgi:CheY-like chemotaxis protein/anti-sigma regulatory factor (Ser/Thr protein kinase)
VARFRALFETLVPRLTERAEEYRADADLLDDETWLLFEGELLRTLVLLEAACVARDAATVRGRGHSLEGMGGTVGLPDLSVVGAELSRAARDEDWERGALLTLRLRALTAFLRGGEEWRQKTSELRLGPSGLAVAPGPSPGPLPIAAERGGGEWRQKTSELRIDPGSPAASPGLSPGPLLIADDDPLNSAVLRRLLKAQGYEVLEAPDGLIALQMARQHLPSLALIDVMMPGLTGYEVCERLKAEPRTREIAVILVTARRGVEDVERGLDAGAFDYVRKPFEPRELLARVRNALALKRSTDELQLWKQKMSREIEVAGSLQRKLFPTHALFGPGFEVHLAYKPSLSIGGDLYDAFVLADGRLCVYMGDVAGHGVAPAIVSALLKAIITEVARDLAAAGPAAVCREIHSRFRYHVANPELFATLFLAFLDTQRSQWTCMNCGHPDPMLLLADGTDVSLSLTGRGDVPIGFWFGGPEGYAAGGAETAAAAGPGSTLWLITDGLFEARHRQTGEPCGSQRLLGLVRRAQADGRSASPAAQLLADLRADGFELNTDDCSAMAVELVDPRSVRLERRLPLDLAAISAAAAEIGRILQAEGWSEEAAGMARLVAMEHSTNIIRHGRPPPQSAIQLQLRVTGAGCRMWFKDQGREWDSSGREKAPTEPLTFSEHGRGLKLIHAVASHAEFFRRDNENVAFFAVDRQPEALQVASENQR